jgi:endonuclease YncB( thermonuclease family)
MIRPALALILALWPVPALADITRHGTVSLVQDGDTLTITEQDDERYVIRLSDIDTPAVSDRLNWQRTGRGHGGSAI